ncbi:sigma-70 family RNA polymerase sigma factor [Candidatus Poribacteria bacterium]|nr:sigma-70 family RNA polymerase sigma factor [Candidatus Poribacteria bacterium]MBT5531583.1 sigma-70 family RNA polymerase sigma factor [Candidatus Poribacteria bacterium]MBT5711848.1 sigma-70 family RNA polymerase sigma factor [Candidatus Poribacteria bacterium]MBT7809300.1 sigma-70 family RNA polymerase sigma factor [Candidatus Poribacteria bacterium]
MNAQQFDAGVLSQLETIRRIGRGRLRRLSDLDDFTQEVLIRLYAGREQLRDAERLPQWAAVIARNLAVQWNRKRAPIPMSALPAVPHGSHVDDDPALLAERWQALVAALDALDPVERDLLVSYYVNEVGYPDLQRRYGLSYSAVGVRLHRAKRKLRTRLRWLVAAVVALFHTPHERAFGGQPMAMSRMSMAFIAGVGATITGAVALGWSMANDADATVPVSEDTVIYVETPASAVESMELSRKGADRREDASVSMDADRLARIDREVEGDGRREDPDTNGDYDEALRTFRAFEREVAAYRAEHGEYPPRHDRLQAKHAFDLEVAAYRAEHGEYPPGFEDNLRKHERALSHGRSPEDTRRASDHADDDDHRAPDPDPRHDDSAGRDADVPPASDTEDDQ